MAFEAEMHRKSLEDLEKEKELLANQFQFEKTTMKTEFDKQMVESTRQLDAKVCFLSVIV